MNHHFVTLPLAMTDALYIPMIALLVPIVVVPTALYFKFQRQRLWHETARVALEKGQPLPVYQTGIDEREPRYPRPRNDMRTGLILIAISVGLTLSPWRLGGTEHFNGLWFGSAIPGCVGVALLLNALLTTIFSKKDRISDSRANTPLSKS